MKNKITIMEVCGTHTMNIARFGLRDLLPNNINVISGPGCPVCVTSSSDINNALVLAERDDVIITTFGDMVRIPCNGRMLMDYKNVRILYDPLDSIELAKNNADKKIVFLGVGFETTTPIVASIIIRANELGLDNFTVLCMNKVVSPALELILNDKQNNIDGFILPGHVAAITGSSYFDFITGLSGRGVISGFDAKGIMDSIEKLSLMITRNEFGVVNNYKGIVKSHGNEKAKKMVKEVFDIVDSDWRGIGVLKRSGLKILEKYIRFDAKERFNIKERNIKDPHSCLCGEVLLGKKIPTDCVLYGKQCVPSSPVGPCMVSSEGTCSAYYKYISN
ncbi:MAG TPA: hydrogenase formation protein HypD [bacterium]|nr:hydrogenase formation protein HypD [bacterium]